ncbi:putative ankyrin repeat protein RF_0381 [Daphnia pulicaria]|uniref:putative ankyrin repeat protein RF_0381 n=1 Tax=Daphnia pulicaria TaxID=35523 RepID=UPI001EEA4358|nr:putative ankyrin repeat protein RF_0381 [Daphnia pulicaria]
MWKDMPIDLFTVILEKSVDVHAQEKNGNTALHLAIMYKSTIAITELLKHRDLDVNLKNNDNQTALHFSCLWEDMPIDLFKIILEKSANINAQDEYGCTALHWAILCEFKTAVEELLKHKDADVNLKNNDNQTACHFTTLWKNIPIDLFRIILEKSTAVIAQNEKELTILRAAIVNRSKTVVEELLKRGELDVKVKYKDNQTVLHLATLWENMPIDLFRIILEKSTDVNVQNEDGETALHCACRYMFKTAITELLKRKDVDVNMKNNDNRTSLHFATKWKNMPMDLFKNILEKTTDVNAQDKHGWTALHWAIAMENRTAVEELLKRKDVDVNLKNKNNQTARFFSTFWEDMPIDLLSIILDK